MTTFRSFDEAETFVKKYGRDYLRPCDKAEIVELEKFTKYAVAIKFRLSGDFIAYVAD